MAITNPAETQTVQELDDRRFEAMIQADVAALRDLLDDTLTYTHSNALREDKSQHLASISAGRVRYKAINRLEQQVSVDGDTAIAFGRAEIDLEMADGQQRQLNVRYTNVWRKRGNTWRMVAWQSTPVPPAAAH